MIIYLKRLFLPLLITVFILSGTNVKGQQVESLHLGDSIENVQEITPVDSSDTEIPVVNEGLLQGGNVIDPSMSAGFTIITLFRGLLGMLVIIIIAWIFSTNRAAISWKVVLIGLSFQILLAV